MLIDRGFLDYDSLISNHWPEFGKNGKAHITVQMVLSHKVFFLKNFVYMQISTNLVRFNPLRRTCFVGAFDRPVKNVVPNRKYAPGARTWR